MRQDIEICDFTAGELSPTLKGRTDLKKYFSGCEVLKNFVVKPQGGATKRPGTLMVYNNKDQANPNRMVPFIFSTLQAYALEFSGGNIRVYKNDGVVLNGGVPVDIATPYATADIWDLSFTQSADFLYIFHPNYQTRTLTRTSHVNWTLAPFATRDGPYLSINTTTNQVTPSGTAGSITLAWDSAANLNGGAGITANDVGRHVRVKLYSLWAWCIITNVIDAKTATATVQAAVNFGATGAIDGTAWAANATYITGSVVKNGGKYYIAVVGGIAGSANGPSGNGTQILDGTVTWSLVGGFASTPWEANTAYDSGVVATDGGNNYLCTVAGISAASGAGPAGTSGAIADGTVTWSYMPPFTFPTKTPSWQMGAWCPSMGFASCGMFWQERLHCAAPSSQPSHEDGSVVGDFTNFAPSLADGTVTDANAVSWTIDDDEVNAINWLSPAGSAQSMQLAMGTNGSEHILQAATTAQALTPTSIQAYRETSYGSAANIKPLRIGKSLLFTDRAGRKMREYSFYWQSNGYLGPDLLQFSDHISRMGLGADPATAGFKWLQYQQSPYQVIWGGLNGGKLVSITYDRDQQIFAPTWHQLGGNYYGGPPMVEAGCVIPSQDGTYDELWLSVARTINGQVVRTTEVLSRYFDAGDLDMAVFVDCAASTALTKPAATLSFSGFTLVNSAYVLPETQSPSFEGDGQLIASSGVFSAANVGNIVRCNGGKLQITAYTDSEHVTATVTRNLASLAPCASGTWSCTAREKTISDLGYLVGEQVLGLGDGANMGELTVSGGGQITAQTGVSYATIGLPYSPVAVLMPFEPQRAAAASSQGKMKAVDTMWIRFVESLGCTFGRRITDDSTAALTDSTEDWQSRIASEPMDNGPPLFSGVKELPLPGFNDREGQIIITQTDPMPLTIGGIYARGDVAELDPQ